MTEPTTKRRKISGSLETAELAIVLRALHAIQHRNGGIPPSVAEIAEEAGMVGHAAHRRLCRLCDFGLIERRSWAGPRVFRMVGDAWRQPPEPLPPCLLEPNEA